MVALALAANAAVETGETGETGGDDTLARIRDHLRAKGVDALIEMIVDLAERDPALFRRLNMAAASVRSDDKTLRSRLRRAIDTATRTRGFIDYREAHGWATDVDQALDALADLLQAGRAELALELVGHAIDRIEHAIEEIDDSDGCCGALLKRAGEIHLEACGAARPDPVKLARDLYAREMEDRYLTFSHAAERYADVLGETGLAEFRRLAEAAWAELPPRAGGDRGESYDWYDYWKIMSLLDFFAERDDDVEMRIALRTKDLSQQENYVELAGFCREQGRADLALRYAEEGLWVFEDSGRPDERLVFLAAELLAAAGRTKDAEAQLWRAFEKAPNVELYRRLRNLGGAPARARAVDHLEARLDGQEPTRRTFPADLLVELFMEDESFDEAWAAARRYGISNRLKESLAKASESTHPREALGAFAERVEELVNLGGNSAYAEAAGLIARMAALRAPSEQAAYVVDLKARHRRKRNFMKLLG
jgi:tetratricopeptide (TPR) repeat protein